MACLRDVLLEKVPGDTARAYIADHFAKYCRRGSLSRFLVRYELLKKVLEVKGHIIECGVQSGVGLLGFWQLSRLLEPHQRRRGVIGFDTFEGFPSVHEKDGAHQVGELCSGTFEEINALIRLHEGDELAVTTGFGDSADPDDKIRVTYGPRIVTVKGDFLTTGPDFIEKNPSVVIALLYLDFDLYEPTKKAIELFVHKMPKGAILAFDEVNNADWPGETCALIDTLGIRNVELKQFSFDKDISYIVM